MSLEITAYYQITIYISIILGLVNCELNLLNKTNLEAVAAYAGSVVRLPCKGAAKEEPVWTYAQSLHNLTFSPLEDKDTIVEEKDALSIYNVGKSETGVYQCHIGASSSLVSLEVVDDDEYTVVKPQTSHGPYASPSTLGNEGLVVLSAWMPWSECSTCGAVGRRRRYGMCHVRPANRNNASGGSSKLSKIDKKIFKDFPDGLPCRSQYLPESIRSLPEVKKRHNEIMIGLCKVLCKKTPKEDVDTFLTLSPNVVRDIVFTKAGQTIKLRCPGAIYRDAPYKWAADGARVSPRALFQDSAGRARIDARDRLVLSPSSHIDAGTYSCGAYDQVAGYVVLVVK